MGLVIRIVHWRKPLALGLPSREFALTRATLSSFQADLVLLRIQLEVCRLANMSFAASLARGLRLVGTETRNRKQDKWAIREVESFTTIYFRRLGRVNESQLFRFLLPFTLALSDLQAPLELLFCCPYF